MTMYVHTFTVSRYYTDEFYIILTPFSIVILRKNKKNQLSLTKGAPYNCLLYIL